LWAAKVWWSYLYSTDFFPFFFFLFSFVLFLELLKISETTFLNKQIRVKFEESFGLCEITK
jgi:hypothetical protein